VHSNDPKQPTTNIYLSCLVKPYIAVTPSDWVKLEGFEGDTITKSVTIASLEEQPFKIEDISCNSKDKIKYELKTTKKGQEYSLEIKNHLTKEGSFNEKIELKTNSEKKPSIVVNVSSHLRTRVTIQTETISFGTIDRKKAGEKNITRRVILNDLKRDVLKVKKFKSSKKWISAEVEQQKEGKYTVVISLDSTKVPVGTFEERVDIYTSVRKEPYVVEINGSVL